MNFSRKENYTYYNPVRRAILNYQMIEPGEKVAVGLSGGKDSTTLFTILDTIRRQKRLGYSFELVPISLDMGFEADNEPLKNYIRDLGYELDVVPTAIAKVVFDIREEKNPCSLCAKLRRGILYNRARELGCQKVALGHHLDDAIETYFMNFLYHGKLTSFEPVTFLSKTELSLIRPLLYVQEKEVIRFVNKKSLPVVFNPCPVDKKTKREEVKQLVTHLTQTYPDIRHRFIQGMEQGTPADFWQVLKTGK